MANPQTSTETVTIGCKLPNGLIMELIALAEGRKLLPAPAGERHILKGSNSRLISVGRSSLGPAAQGVHLYGQTRVPKDFAEEWFRRNKDLDCVKRGLVFMETSKERATAVAKEREEDSQTRTGLEALAESGDPRMKSAGRVGADKESMRNWEAA